MSVNAIKETECNPGYHRQIGIDEFRDNDTIEHTRELRHTPILLYHRYIMYVIRSDVTRNIERILKCKELTVSATHILRLFLFFSILFFFQVFLK